VSLTDAPIDDEEQLKIISFAYNRILMRFSYSRYIVRQMKEDLFQVGYMEIYRIHREYGDAIKGFGTYALYCILREMAKEVIKEEKHHAMREDDFDITLLPQEVYVAEEVDMGFLSAKEKGVFTLLLEGYTLREIARELKVRPETVQQMVSKLKERLASKQ